MLFIIYYWVLPIYLHKKKYENVLFQKVQMRNNTMLIFLEFYHHHDMVAAPPNFRGDLKTSDQNSWGGSEQKIKFGGGGRVNLKGDIKF